MTDDKVEKSLVSFQARGCCRAPNTYDMNKPENGEIAEDERVRGKKMHEPGFFIF